MSLASIHASVTKLLGQPTIDLTKTLISSNSYEQVLALLRQSDVSIALKAPITLDPAKLENAKRLTIAGTATIFGQGKTTTIGFSEAAEGSLVCDLEVRPTPDERFTIKDLEGRFLSTGASSVLPALKEVGFTLKSLRARSSTRTMEIDVSLAGPAELELLTKPSLKLVVEGLVLRTFLLPAWVVADVRFGVKGLLRLSESESVGVLVELPIGTTRGARAWRLTLTDPAATGKALSLLATVASDKILASVPDAIKPDAVAKVGSFAVDFTLQPPSIHSVQTAITIKNPWALPAATGEDSALQLSSVVLQALVLRPLQSPETSLWASGQFALGEGKEKKVFDAVASLTRNGREAVLSLSTFNALTLKDLSQLPGGATLDSLNLPELSKIGVRLAALRLAFDLDAPGVRKFRSIEIDVNSTWEWELVGGVLSIVNPQFFLYVEPPLAPTSGQLEALLQGDLALLQTAQSKPRVRFVMARTEGRWILEAEALEEIPLGNVFGGTVEQERLGVDFPKDVPASEELAALMLSGLQARYATQTAKHPTEFSFSATVVRIPGFKLGNIAVNVQSLSVELSSSKKDNEQRQTSMTLKGCVPVRHGSAVHSVQLPAGPREELAGDDRGAGISGRVFDRRQDRQNRSRQPEHRGDPARRL